MGLEEIFQTSWETWAPLGLVFIPFQLSNILGRLQYSFSCNVIGNLRWFLRESFTLYGHNWLGTDKNRTNPDLSRTFQMLRQNRKQKTNVEQHDSWKTMNADPKQTLKALRWRGCWCVCCCSCCCGLAFLRVIGWWNFCFSLRNAKQQHHLIMSWICKIENHIRPQLKKLLHRSFSLITDYSGIFSKF